MLLDSLNVRAKIRKGDTMAIMGIFTMVGS